MAGSRKRSARLTPLRASPTFGKAADEPTAPGRIDRPRGAQIMTTAYSTESLKAHPPYLYPDYRSTVKRAPSQPLVLIPHTLSELTGPVYGHESVREHDTDLTRQHAGEPLGERIIVSGRVLDEDGRPVPNTLLEIWQANAAGRYIHVVDQHPAPIDPNFSGAGRVVTDSQGRYRFTTIKPGASPWKNQPNAWRPAHIHFSLFGPSFLTRLVTQMYFPGDPLLPLDPMWNCVPDEKARYRMISSFDIETTEPEWALGYRFDIVLRGRDATPMEDPHDD
jgi:protocatechuate 3,4-dioxygenase, beta subunit